MRTCLSPRWRQVLALALTETISYGVLYYAFTVFLAPMQAELGWSRSLLTGAFSLALLLSGLAGLLAGHWLDRYGPRLLMTGGSVLAALLVLAWAHVHSVLAFYLIWAALGLVMATVLYEPAFWVVAAWFPRGRGRALTVLTFIAGFASVIFIPLAGWLVRTGGWRQALVILAIILAGGTIPLHALVLRRGPAPVTGSPPASTPLRRVLLSPPILALTAAFFLNTLGSTALVVHLVPLLVGRGYSLAFATGMAGLVGALGLPGRLIFTPLGDRLRRSWVAAAIFVTHALSFVALLVLPGVLGVITFVLLFGGGFGAITPARAALVADVAHPRQYGRLNSVVALGMTLARALGPLGMSALYDLTSGYTLALELLIVTSLLGAAALLAGERWGGGYAPVG